MKIVIIILLFSISTIHSQDLHHQMLSSQGTSKVLPNGMYVSQTIGQQSVTGNYTTDNKTFGQGFQQVVWSKYISGNTNNSITTITYPNPFVANINFQFSIPIKEPIKVSVFDVRGRRIFTQEKQANNNILSIDLQNLASSNYLVQLSAHNFLFYTQILKQ